MIDPRRKKPKKKSEQETIAAEGRPVASNTYDRPLHRHKAGRVFSGGPAPRIGGSKAPATPIALASEQHMKAGRRLRRMTGTGSGVPGRLRRYNRRRGNV